ncbi:MAG: acyl-CoA dehydratase activase [Clostridia bacterium]|nr:acyl-CoA dehydratase activase [Clostridia bacterium]
MKQDGYYIGIDVGSVSTNLVIIDENDKVIEKLYLRTSGQPINVLIKGMQLLAEKFGKHIHIKGVGTTGSGRQLASVIVGADIVKNEITSHAVATQKTVPGVKTILEIGGQDSKIIILKNGVVNDFAMNTVCAAGTGSFLDRQASRLEIPIEEFGGYALRSKSPVRIAGRCAVFAESDMIHKQQTGHSTEDIVNGLCQALVRNYLNNLAKGKDIEEPIAFQGGVAANVGIVAAFENQLKKKIIIPEHYDVMGAYGAALIAKKEATTSNFKTSFHGFGVANHDYRAKSVECQDCSNACEVIKILSDNTAIARWGDRCGKWSQQTAAV